MCHSMRMTISEFYKVLPLLYANKEVIWADSKMFHAQTPILMYEMQPVPLGALLMCYEEPQQVEAFKANKACYNHLKRLMFDIPHAEAYTIDEVVRLLQNE